MLDLINEASLVATSKLFAILLGSSGAGKSHVAGTAPGKILYLYLDSERHGVTSASKSSSDVLAVCIDRTAKGETLKPEEAFKRGLALLEPEGLKKAKIASVVIDGLTELEKLVRSTSVFKNKCLSTAGKHNSFAEPAATVEMLDEYMRAARRAQDEAGVHIIITGIIDVQEIDDNGAIGVAKPRLSGYSVAEAMIQQFPDILVIGKMTNAQGKSDRVFQTTADVQRISKDQNGTVKKFINFDCRLAMPAGRELPPYIKADLKAVIALKEPAK